MSKTIAVTVLIDADQFEDDAAVFALMNAPLASQRAVVMVGGREFAGDVRGAKVEGAP